MKRLTSRTLWAGLLLLSSGLANAGITLSGTRVVLQAPAKETSILVRNQAPEDVMIQSWMEIEGPDDSQDLPFAITPNLSRLGANRQQSLRILFQGQGLPTDRESVFRLSVQEIPQKSANDNTVQIALRQRIKVFYRPAGLPGAAADAPMELKWRLIQQGGKPRMEVINNSAFHVSLADAKLKNGSKSYDISVDMVRPRSSSQFDIKELTGVTSINDMNIEFQIVNDFGGLDKYSSAMSN
ncbi:molecular chaperone [Pseudomonas sp. BN606]|uniref:fimbrial biogenesis chaperone n=1 Tax=Pseudomonas sp. BN606 TaxID=2567894 RepID=UPI0012C53B72|nr:molecular chaperone [Pseudomonas sp. BN606]MDH4656008.1 molecular chaperone [Pseudomonas sp. BN606]MRK21370.1 molecular chaperone [Pseudomonas sp. JG-B]